MVALGIGLDRTIGVDLASGSGSLLIDGTIHLVIILLIVIGSGLAVLGALKVTEWVRMPAQKRNRVRPAPVLTTTWTIALFETTVLLSLTLMWMVRVWGH